MFEIDMEMLKEQGLQFVDTAKKAAQELADKGKNQLELLNQQARLSKAQRQLGALVYSLHKAGEENQPLVDKYIAAVAEVEKAIEDIKAAMTPEERAEAEAQEAADAGEPVVSEDGEDSEEEIEEEPVKLRGETKICPVCHAEVDAEALFCNHGGAQLYCVQLLRQILQNYAQLRYLCESLSPSAAAVFYVILDKCQFESKMLRVAFAAPFR